MGIDRAMLSWLSAHSWNQILCSHFKWYRSVCIDKESHLGYSMWEKGSKTPVLYEPSSVQTHTHSDTGVHAEWAGWRRFARTMPVAVVWWDLSRLQFLFQTCLHCLNFLKRHLYLYKSTLIFKLLHLKIRPIYAHYWILSISWRLKVKIKITHNHPGGTHVNILEYFLPCLFPLDNSKNMYWRLTICKAFCKVLKIQGCMRPKWCALLLRIFPPLMVLTGHEVSLHVDRASSSGVPRFPVTRTPGLFWYCSTINNTA